MQDEWGITDGYFEVSGVWHPTTDIARDRLRAAMGTPVAGPPMWFVPAGEQHSFWNPCRIVLEDGTDLGVLTAIPADLPLGYHDLEPVDSWPSTRLVVYPPACKHIPRVWGLAVQVYALCSTRSWGIGDLGDLTVLATKLAAAGGGAILVSPLHQPALTRPQEDSPYYPSSRRSWNPLLLALDEIPPAALTCNPAQLIDRDAAWDAKAERLQRAFDQMPVPAPLPDSVAMWNALCDEFGADWQTWPEPLRRFDRDELQRRLAGDRQFARRAGFHQWCQELIAGQLRRLAATSVDIIGDLAIGFSPRGADAWEFQNVLALDMRIGAPPDPFNEAGQDWSIPPFVPWRLRNARYEPFIATIRSCLRGVRGLRIDHVMGLFRQFWMPADGSPADGAYVRFPADELLAILCLEAVRANAYIIGEDLGTVEPGVRETLARHNIAGTRVLWFETEHPSTWPANSLATITTHDLPTIAGVFTATDGTDEQRDRLDLVAPTGLATAAEVATAAHDALARSPAGLRLFALDDVCLATERPNHPGTVNRLNWRRRLPLDVDDIEIRAAELTP